MKRKRADEDSGGSEFPVLKLVDYQKDRERLEEDRNPYAVVVLAYLRKLDTRSGAKQRLQSKVALVRMLYEW